MRQDALAGLVSKESPIGKALLGHKVGDTVHIQVSDSYGYDALIRQVEKCQDDGTIPISSY
jgi:transcription elongation factor GreA